jgi:hypothetical protein
MKDYKVSLRLTYTGFLGGLEHIKIETRLIDERFVSVMGECVIVTLKVRRHIQSNPFCRPDVGPKKR